MAKEQQQDKPGKARGFVAVNPIKISADETVAPGEPVTAPDKVLKELLTIGAIKAAD